MESVSAECRSRSNSHSRTRSRSSSLLRRTSSGGSATDSTLSTATATTTTTAIPPSTTSAVSDVVKISGVGKSPKHEEEGKQMQELQGKQRNEQVNKNKNKNKDDDKDDDKDDEKDDEGVESQEIYTDESEGNITAMIQVYKNILHDLADPKVNEKVNYALDRISYAAFVQYYQENAALSDYSMEKELNRMNYCVTLDGVTTSDKDEILDFYWETRLDDIWRYANQSIYADLLMNIMSYFQGLNLNLNVQLSDSSFELNMDDEIFGAVALFDVILESNEVENHKLVIATITGHILLNLGECTVVQRLDQPSINVVFDSQLRQAAITFLASEDSDMEMLLEVSQRKRIDSFVDIMTETAQALPEQISSLMPRLSLEGAVGFFGKLIGANEENDYSNQNIGELTTIIRENANLSVKSAIGSQHLSSCTATSSASPHSQDEMSSEEISQKITCTAGQEECWDEWD
jgi:Rieske Fe-S protein